MTARLPPIWHAAALRPLAPLVLAAWEDGSLTPGELLDLRSALERSPGLSHEERTSVRAFLDPSAPPSPQALLALERAVRASLEAVPAEQRRTLESLTSALSGGGADAARAVSCLMWLSGWAMGCVPHPASAMASKAAAATTGPLFRHIAK